ncbi:hypothetical protein ACSBLW_18620 [Thioclava sp. FR2]|uniref:hypothetical protein n=1 Tax=Thioclava sp. FR2 TaxID=3445780 RepID=UPI003EBE4FFE
MDNGRASDLIRRIIDGALGDLAHWQKPVSRPGIGPGYPEVFDRFQQEISQMRAAMESRLALWSIDELGKIVPESEAPRLNPLFDHGGRLGHLALGLQSLKNRVPHDFAGGWSVAGKEVDLPYWSAFKSVSLDHAVFLSLGHEPRKSNFDSICKAYGRSDEEDAVLYFLEDRRELIANAMGCDSEDSNATVELKAFFDWVEETRLPIDPAFYEALRARFRPTSLEAEIEPVTDAPVGDPDNRRIDTRERNSLAKLITAMAIDAYGYDPGAARGPIPKELEGIAAQLGLEITADTIRKFLRDGAQYLPEGWNRNSD